MSKFSIVALVLVVILVIVGFLFFAQGQKVEKLSAEPKEIPVNAQTAVVGSGCFWCVEADFAKLDGVYDVVSGYAGGETDNPTYKDYAFAGHREVVLVSYDPEKLSFAQIVEYNIKHGDPMDAEGSFFDRGFGYSPVVMYADEAEKEIAEEVVAKIDSLGVYDKPLAMAIVERARFWPAEDYHQDYAVKNPVRYGYYRNGSGRDRFIEKYWGDKAGEFVE